MDIAEHCITDLRSARAWLDAKRTALVQPFQLIRGSVEITVTTPTYVRIEMELRTAQATGDIVAWYGSNYLGFLPDSDFAYYIICAGKDT